MEKKNKKWICHVHKSSHKVLRCTLHILHEKTTQYTNDKRQDGKWKEKSVYKTRYIKYEKETLHTIMHIFTDWIRGRSYFLSCLGLSIFIF